MLRLWSSLATCLLLSACASSLTGHASGDAKIGVPADRFQVQVFVCADGAPPSCHSHDATAAQVSRLRARLVADTDVTHVLPLSPAQALGVEDYRKQIIIPDFTPPGAEFLVAITSGASASTVAARYAHVAGVASVGTCINPARCSVATLRALRIVH